MSSIESGQVSGHVFRYRGARGDAWYAKYRLPDGRQVQKRIGSCAELTLVIRGF